MQPISKKRQVQFRGPTSSEEFNEYLSDTYFDISQLFRIASEHDIKIPENLEILMNENHFLSQKIEWLEDQLESIANSIVDDKRSLVKSFNSMDDLEAEDLESLIDTEYRVITQPIAQQVSKTYLLNDGVSMIPEELEVTVYESTEPFQDITNISNAYRVEDDKVYNAFDNDRSKYWQKKVLKPNTENTLYVALHIKLPQNIINHFKVNTIYLRPSPEYGQSLLDIQYKGPSTWSRLPTYPTYEAGGEVPTEIPNSPRQMFLFGEIDITELVIYLKQPHWFEEGGDRAFVYGFQNIEVMFTRFEEEETTFRTKFTIPNEDKSFEKIDGVTIRECIGGVEAKDLVSYRIFVEGDENPYALESILPMLTKTIYIETTMRTNKGENFSPALEGIEIKYTAI